jgi:hypothetical protein
VGADICPSIAGPERGVAGADAGAAGGVAAGVGAAWVVSPVGVAGAPWLFASLLGCTGGVPAGAPSGTSSKTLLLVSRAVPYVSVSDVSINTMAVPVVSFVNRLPAPELPKIVWLEPPKTALTSDPFPCCNSTTAIRKKQERI